MRSVTRVMAVSMLTACSGGVTSRFDSDASGSDRTPPTIQHTAITAGQPFGSPVAITATVTDEHDIERVSVVYRKETEADWKTADLTAGADGAYSGSIPGADVGSGGMHYYLEAVDEYDNLGCMPEDCEEDSWRFGVTAPAAQ